MVTMSLESPNSADEGSLHDLIEDESAVRAYDNLEAQEAREHLLRCLESLPYRQRKVLHLYYFEGMKISKIAVTLGVSEARISQIRTEALQCCWLSFRALSAVVFCERLTY